MSSQASVVTEDLKENKETKDPESGEKKRTEKEGKEKSSLGKVKGMKGKVRKRLKPLLQAVGRIGRKVDQNERKLHANEDELVKFASGVNEGMAELKKATAEQGEVMREIHGKLGEIEAKRDNEKSVEDAVERKPSLWQRFKNRMGSLGRGAKKSGEKVGDGVVAVGSGIGGAFREAGHQIAEAGRGVDDALQDATRLVVGKGAGNVMKYGSYVAAGAPAWMPKVWNFLTGKDGNGKPIEKKTFGRKLAIAAGWTTAGAALLASPWNLVWMGIPTAAWGVNTVGKKLVAESEKPEGLKWTARTIGGAGALYGATVSGGFLTSSFLWKAGGAGLLGRLYRWARGGGSSRKEKRSSSKPAKQEEPAPESDVAAPPDVKKILDEMEASRQEQAKDHDQGHGKEGHATDDHSHPEQKPEQKEPQSASAHGKAEEAVRGESGEVANAKTAAKPETPGAH